MQGERKDELEEEKEKSRCIDQRKKDRVRERKGQMDRERDKEKDVIIQEHFHVASELWQT